jgi:hypothetical protein
VQAPRQPLQHSRWGPSVYPPGAAVYRGGGRPSRHIGSSVIRLPVPPFFLGMRSRCEALVQGAHASVVAAVLAPEAPAPRLRRGWTAVAPSVGHRGWVG